MAPSTYYAAKTRGPSQRACRDAVLGPALVGLWRDNYCVYGAHKLWKTARRAGHDVGRDQVLAVTDDADDAVAVDADVIFGVGVHGDGLIVAVT